MVQGMDATWWTWYAWLLPLAIDQRSADNICKARVTTFCMEIKLI